MSILVKFKSKAAGDIVMYREHAGPLFQIMGLELNERGVIEADQMAQRVAPLKAAFEQAKQAQKTQPELDTTDLDPEELRAIKNQVGLHQRAFPLLNMMEAAAAKGVDVHWGF